MQTQTPVILIVDDTPVNIDLVEGILTGEGFRTLTASDGPSARLLSRGERPDLILLDVVMPGESGFETCALLKQDPATADIPVIFLSALDTSQDKVKGLKIGGVDFISKPVHGEEVLARVRVHLRLREANRLLIEQQQERFQQLTDAQHSILTKPSDCPGAPFAVYYRPLETASGDFYDVVMIDREVTGYFVADISGHGVGAAFFTPALKALLRQYGSPVFSMEETMHGIDLVMRQVLGEEQYLTACYARLNRRTSQLAMINAGHPPAILVRASGKVEMKDSSSEPLGVFPTIVLERNSFQVGPGDRLFLYTDGLIEASPGGGRRAGIEGLAAAAVRHRKASLEQAVSSIMAEVRPEGAPLEDDLLLLGMEV